MMLLEKPLSGSSTLPYYLHYRHADTKESKKMPNEKYPEGKNMTPKDENPCGEITLEIESEYIKPTKRKLEGGWKVEMKNNWNTTIKAMEEYTKMVAINEQQKMEEYTKMATKNEQQKAVNEKLSELMDDGNEKISELMDDGLVYIVDSVDCPATKPQKKWPSAQLQEIVNKAAKNEQQKAIDDGSTHTRMASGSPAPKPQKKRKSAQLQAYANLYPSPGSCSTDSCDCQFESTPPASDWGVGMTLGTTMPSAHGFTPQFADDSEYRSEPPVYNKGPKVDPEEQKRREDVAKAMAEDFLI
jgi:hypothetical protein